jgi:hypothetical protein
MHEQKRSTKKAKIGKSPGEDYFNSELYTYAGDMFHDRLLVFL